MKIAEVIVDLAIWGLNRPLSYFVPDRFADRATLGSIVRVPLRSRRVRGWIVDITDHDQATDDLQEIAGVSGRGPVFDEFLLQAARETSRELVHPLSTMLGLMTPQRLGRPVSQLHPSEQQGKGFDLSLRRIGVLEDSVGIYSSIIADNLEKRASTIVAVPEVAEGSRVIEQLSSRFLDDFAVVHSDQDPADRSKALWEVAEGKRKVVLGGRAAVFVPRVSPATIIIHQEHDRSFKEQRAPYYNARDFAITRARTSKANVLLASRTPSLESMHRFGANLIIPPREADRSVWPIVEVVEPDRTGIPRRAVAAIIEAFRRKEKALVLLPRTESTRAGPGPARLVEYLARVVPGAKISRADRPGLQESSLTLKDALQTDVVIATVAALNDVERPDISTAIALGVDSHMFKPSGHAMEESFTTLWTLATLVAGRATRGRLLLETEKPEHHVIQSLTRGDYDYFASRELKLRQVDDLPPFLRFFRLQIAGQVSDALLQALRSLPGTDVLGPVPGGKLGTEILLKVRDAETIFDPLGSIVAASNERVLVEVDPKDW